MKNEHKILSHISFDFCVALILVTSNCVVQEISGRIVRVEFAKSLKKPPSSPPPKGLPPSDARYVIYASNLAWKARSTHLRDIFTENFKEPVSARVVFQTADGRSAGYGFVSYHTKEEAEAAVSALDGKVVIISLLMVTYLCYLFTNVELFAIS
jgi:RNA recognition motif-containing protein